MDAMKTRATSLPISLASAGSIRATASCGATASTTWSRRAGTESRRSAPYGAMAARGSFVRPERRCSAPSRQRSLPPLGAFPKGRPRGRTHPMIDDAPKRPEPPRADIRPSTLSAHGLTWTDDYAWIRAENWREVLRDPGRLPGDVRTLLEAEN